ncbi:MAG: hypothetical protein U5L09_18620 [Bacteroidales bacterium]|nr:hypothetical protein [Bacteroidales bacterium]
MSLDASCAGTLVILPACMGFVLLVGGVPRPGAFIVLAVCEECCAGCAFCSSAFDGDEVLALLVSGFSDIP